MKINKTALKMYGVTENDYLDWCKEKKKSAYRADVKEDFFWRLRTGRLVKDQLTGKLLVKKPRKKK